MEDPPLFSLWKGRSYRSKIVIRAFFTALSTPDHFALLRTVGCQGAPFCAESALQNWRTEFLLCWSLRPGLRTASRVARVGPTTTTCAWGSRAQEGTQALAAGLRPQRLITGPMSRLRQLLPSSGDRDNQRVRRTRAALDTWPAPGPMPAPTTVALTPDPGRAGSRRGAPGIPDPGGPGTGRPSGRTRGRGERARFARAGR